MSLELGIELHARSCGCRGGAWATIGGVSGAVCRAANPDTPTVTLSHEEWKGLGKPPTVEDYEQAAGRAAAGDRREFPRFHAVLKVRLSRTPDWRKPARQVDETVTEIVARGGAMVRTRIPVQPGEVILFEQGEDYKTRAEVGYVSSALEEGQRFLRVGLRFLDAPFPDEQIPKDSPA